jgi:hypothetical protein
MMGLSGTLSAGYGKAHDSYPGIGFSRAATCPISAWRPSGANTTDGMMFGTQVVAPSRRGNLIVETRNATPEGMS